MTSHAPSSRLGACQPCANGDHGGCDAVIRDSDCICYEDSWEWHETVGYERIMDR